MGNQSNEHDPQLFDLLKQVVEHEVRKRMEDEIVKPMVKDYEEKLRYNVRAWTEQITIEAFNKSYNTQSFAKEMRVVVAYKEFRGGKG